MMRPRKCKTGTENYITARRYSVTIQGLTECSFTVEKKQRVSLDIIQIRQAVMTIDETKTSKKELVPAIKKGGIRYRSSVTRIDTGGTSEYFLNIF